MKVLLLAESASDFSRVLESCNAEIHRMTERQALGVDLTAYDAYCVLGTGKRMDPRIRQVLEAEAAGGKHLFAEAVGSLCGIYSGNPTDTTRRRLIYVEPRDGNGIPGLTTGDLLDDQANSAMSPWYQVPDYKPLLVYKTQIIAHDHLNASAEEILQGGSSGLWMLGESIMMTSFRLRNYNKARFAPRESWEKLIRFVAAWITGSQPAYLPEPTVRYGAPFAAESFDACRRRSIEAGIGWLKRYLVDEGRCGVAEGLRHNVDPDGNQARTDVIRSDCSGETAGALKMYARLYGDETARQYAENLDGFVFGPMQVKGGLFDGMIRWTDDAWEVCYQDDVARCILSGLYECLFMGKDTHFGDICRALDFLVRTTAQDGCRVPRTDSPGMDENSFKALAAAEHGCHSAHYNAYYHAALLLACKHGGNPTYLEVGRKGLETLMALYPDTVREQSETEEMCRLVLPLAALYDVTGEASHREMLYRVVKDLETHKHPSGGYREWDTGYKASCSRESSGECSLLTENGDPVADLLYSTNWLPVGFAYAYHVTRDEWFRMLWREVVGFCMSAQVFSEDPDTNGSWCRAFDMERRVAYGCPHDVGWAAYASESGWTNAEILMGMMLPDILENGNSNVS